MDDLLIFHPNLSSTRFVVTLDSAKDQYQHVDTSVDLGTQDDGEEWDEGT